MTAIVKLIVDVVNLWVASALLPARDCPSPQPSPRERGEGADRWGSSGRRPPRLAPFAKGQTRACIRRTASLIAASFRRGSDLLGRWDGGGIAVLAHGASDDKLADYARVLAQRVQDQQVHHPRSRAKFVTVSVGVASCLPMRDQPVTLLVNAAEAALRQAKSQGRNRVAIAAKGDYTA